MRVKRFLQGSSPIWIALLGATLLFVFVANIPGITNFMRVMLGGLVGAVLLMIIIRHRYDAAFKERLDELTARRGELEQLFAAVKEREAAALKAHADLLNVAGDDPIFIICAYRENEHKINVMVRQDRSLHPAEALEIVSVLGSCLESLTTNPAASNAEWN